MPSVPTTNNGTVYYNQNYCYSFNQLIGASLVQLSSFPCAELIIVNKTGGNVTIYDNGYNATGSAFLLSTNDQFTFRGLTNSAVVSASAVSTGLIYCRAQYFSQSVHTAV